MIERQKVKGKDALVQYLKKDLRTPTSKEEAETVRIAYDDGKVEYGVLNK